MSNVRLDAGRPGDPAVDQAWRTAATDEPSARTDATILAAARAATVRNRSASAPPATRHWWTHWQPFAAAAGVAGLAFTIVQMLPREVDVPMAPATEQAIERPLPGRSERLPQQNAAPDAAPAPPPTPREADAEQPTTAKRAVPAVPPRPSLPPESAAARDVAGARAEADASSEQRVRQIAPSAAAPVTPEQWARRIEALYGTGDQGAAADLLQAFRRAYPDADQYLAEALLPWAASIGEQPAQAKEPAGITP